MTQQRRGTNVSAVEDLQTRIQRLQQSVGSPPAGFPSLPYRHDSSPPPSALPTAPNPQSPAGVLANAETMVQRMNRMMNTHRDASRQSSRSSISSRPSLSLRGGWRNSMALAEEDEPPHTPTNGTSGNDQPPAAPLNATEAAGTFARDGPRRQESPSPTRPAVSSADRYRARRQRTSLQSIEGGQLYYDAFGGRDPWDSVFGPVDSDLGRHPMNSLRRHSSMSLHEIFRETLRHEPVS